MPRRAHDNCPSCACWEAEDGEVATTTLNGIPVPPGDYTIGPNDQVRVTFTKTTEGDTP